MVAKFASRCILLVPLLCVLGFPVDETKYQQSTLKTSAYLGRNCTFYNYLPKKNSPRRCEIKGNTDKYPRSHTFLYEHYGATDRADVTRLRKGYGYRNNKYYLSILAMFKNEATIMKEWLDHHIAHGVDHFYLIDDNSVDNVYDIMDPYLEKGYVSFHKAPDIGSGYRQIAAYHRIFSDFILSKNESRWVAILDLDEFLYSPRYPRDLKRVFREHEDLSIVGVNWAMFGSSNFLEQPKSVVDSFLYRADYTNYDKYLNLTDHYKVLKKKNNTLNDWQKYVVNTAYRISSVEVHQAYVEGTSDNLSINRDAENPYLIVNHYSIQSKKYFLKNKASRGDVNGYYNVTDRNIDWFRMCDINEIRDDRLKLQNAAIIANIPASSASTNSEAAAAAVAVARAITKKVDVEQVRSPPSSNTSYPQNENFGESPLKQMLKKEPTEAEMIEKMKAYEKKALENEHVMLKAKLDKERADSEAEIAMFVLIASFSICSVLLCCTLYNICCLKKKPKGR